MTRATCPHCGSEMTIRARILDELRANGPTSSGTLAERLGVRDESCRRMVLQMKDDGLVVAAGRSRKSPKGAGAVLWGLK